MKIIEVETLSELFEPEKPQVRFMTDEEVIEYIKRWR